MSRGRRAAVLAAVCGLAALALPSFASARVAYVTGSSIYANSNVVPVELSTGTVGAEIPIQFEGSPSDVAISPDGKTAYVTGGEELWPIDVATNTVGTPITVVPCPRSIAIKRDGSSIYVVNFFSGDVSVVDAATKTELKKIPVGAAFGANASAVTPDGTKAYVSTGAEETVTPIDLTTDTTGTPIEVGQSPQGIAVTPDGTRVYVTVQSTDAIRRIDIATNTVSPPIGAGKFPDQIATTPDSSRAYVISGGEPVMPIDLATDTAGTGIPVANGFFEDLAITPDGSRAWLTDNAQSGGNRLVPIDIPANTPGAPINGIQRPGAIAIVPNQPPHAAFSVSPSPALRGDTVSFDAAASTDSDGSVARYVWDFGDGGDPVVGGPTAQHAYSFGGTYTVTLTTTDNEGCSLTVVFPGQTAFCNGSAVARTTRQVQVNPKCIEVTGSASSFVPKYRAARVVPGVRLRLAASAPSRLTVDATLSWSRGGGGSVDLKQLVTNVQHWRRVRFTIPAKLRSKLPLGLPVALKLRIEAQPLDETLCPGKVVTKTLHLRVVKVIPGSVQAGRRR
jgi:YVTN family beta-propeller protein